MKIWHPCTSEGLESQELAQMCSWTLLGLYHMCVFAGMSLASVTLASVLQVRGEALSEEELWSLLSLAAERLLEDLHNGKSLGQ